MKNFFLKTLLTVILILPITTHIFIIRQAHKTEEIERKLHLEIRFIKELMHDQNGNIKDLIDLYKLLREEKKNG